VEATAVLTWDALAIDLAAQSIGQLIVDGKVGDAEVNRERLRGEN
jgi:hypothetical protein